MKCEDFMTCLPMAPDGLSADLTDAFHQHIAECEQCERQWKQQQAMLLMLHSLDDDLAVPVELSERWSGAIKTEKKRNVARKRRFQNRIIGLAASVILVLGTILMREGFIFQMDKKTANEPVLRFEAEQYDEESSGPLRYSDDSDTILFLDETPQDSQMMPFSAMMTEEVVAFDSTEEYGQADTAQAMSEAMMSGGGSGDGMVDSEGMPQADAKSAPLFKRSWEAFYGSLQKLPDFFADCLVFISYIAPYIACVAVMALLIGMISKAMKKRSEKT